MRIIGLHLLLLLECIGIVRATSPPRSSFSSSSSSSIAHRRPALPLEQALSPWGNASVVVTSAPVTRYDANMAMLIPRPPDCPPCECNPFNCVLPAFACLNNGACNDYNGQCVCPPGFGGEDCGKPLCGSLADGQERFPRESDQCECDEGWSGINCNVCETDKACSALVLRNPGDMNLKPDGNDQADEDTAVCYKEGFAVREMYQMCDVTNRKILDMLPDRPPQVTFTCDVSSASCGFQFWIGSKESFFCGLNNCTTHHEVSYEQNSTEYTCEHMSCSCIPGRMLCGEDGSVDITDFLTEEVKGPGKFSSRTGEDSRFEEPAMNQLISDIFGDTYITLKCKSGECLRANEVPGFVRPPKPNSRTWVIVTVLIAVAILLLGLFLFWYLGRANTNVEYSFLGGRIRLPGNGNTGDGPTNESLLEDHIPTALQFSALTYTLPNGQRVLDGISGAVQPGEIMAVIGASGAGKSTFLDLLARKRKQGSVTGDILVNGRKVSDNDYRRVVGFVDQEDTLMGTLTVYETVLYSALLRLPRNMSFEDKKMRTLETMHELGILGIRDSRIGESGQRSISGGEKRRVSIACELVTSPSILFLDEPTSGLDSYNAYNVIESLVTLARNYKRTVVFTIHQPRSNIVALFDKLVLLASGKVVYSGAAEGCQPYFQNAGYPCPPGFNIADHLIDLTMQNEKANNDAIPGAEAALIQLDGEQDAVAVDDPELGGVQSRRSASTTELAAVPNTPNGKKTTGRTKTLRNGLSNGHGGSEAHAKLASKLQGLVETFAKSDTARANKDEIERARSTAAQGHGHGSQQALTLRSYQRASWWTQFTILSGRSFKNLYRNPMLMWSHYAVAVVVACICAVLFRNLTEDIPGFQNRMGFGFFVLSLFGFGCLTSLNAFASERLLFMRERANGYYHPVTYFAAKVLFDVVPLRVIPPFVFGAIVYAPIGLVPTVSSFWSFILVLVMFNLTASSVVLFLSVLVRDTGVANLIGSLLMLFNLLFAGLLINKEKLPPALRWLEDISFFHAAFEAFLVNEVRYLQLRDHKYGIDIEVPAAAILSTFGFSLRFTFDMLLLLGVFAAFTGLSFVALVLFVKERR